MDFKKFEFGSVEDPEEGTIGAGQKRLLPLRFLLEAERRLVDVGGVVAG